MKSTLQNYIKRFITLDNDEFEAFYNFLEPQEFEKKDYLLRTGNICRNYYFITSGLIRIFNHTPSGAENIMHFGIENWWITHLDSFVNETPSKVFVQALEKTSVMAIRKTNLEKAFTEIPNIERLFRIIAEKSLIALQRNSHFYMKESSKDRYQHLINTIPDFAQRVPQYMIASYLDITPEYLSEIRKSM